MKLVTLDVGHAGSLGAIVGTGEVLHLSKFAQEGGLEALLPETMIGLLSAGQEALQVVRDMVSRCEALGDGDKQRLSERGHSPARRCSLRFRVPAWCSRPD